MKKFIFGYGSLINLESAGRTLQRPLTREEVYTVTLNGYTRCWNLFDDVFSEIMNEEVKAVFLNIANSENSNINGIILPVNELELSEFKTREKNYDCVDVTKLIKITDERSPKKKYRVYTFVGKASCLTENINNHYFVFQKYINIVERGVNSFTSDFTSEFHKTTMPLSFEILQGDYKFIDAKQQKAR